MSQAPPPKSARPLSRVPVPALTSYGNASYYTTIRTGRGRSDHKNISPLSASTNEDGCRPGRAHGDVPPLRPVLQRVAASIAVPDGAGRVHAAPPPADAARGPGHRPPPRRRERVRRHVRGRVRGRQQGSYKIKHVCLGWFVNRMVGRFIICANKFQPRSCVQNIINYFTYKATHTVLHQLYEMNPPSYTWLYK
jgi:hypothetical protein